MTRELKWYTRKYLYNFKNAVMEEQRDKRHMNPNKKMAGINLTFSIITFHITGLNSPIKSKILTFDKHNMIHILSTRDTI